MTTYHTNYPFVGLGDAPGKRASVRACRPLAFDGDKYLQIIVEGRTLTVKAGHMYRRKGPYGTSLAISGQALRRLTV
jgi:hypothetical protein